MNTMASSKICLKNGPAQDVIISLNAKELFATHQMNYILQSPTTLAEDGAAIILDASHWWFDGGSSPETLKVEKRKNMVVFIGHKFIEQSHGDSVEVLGECEFSCWITEVNNLLKNQKSA